MNLSGYGHLAGAGPFAHSGDPAFAGISGGRTSAMMASLLDPAVALCFANTGREHEATLVFLQRLADGLQRPIVWLEWRPPPERGDPPKKFRHAVVTFETATRGGDLFEGLLQALADYRATKGEGPISPWPGQRLCTAYLKHRVQESYRRSLGSDHRDAHDVYIGLRSDEPARIARLRSRETQTRTYRTPLGDAHVTKAAVNQFWSRQSFDLEINHDRQGNCGSCFLKDYADQARVLGEDWSDAAWWIDIQRRYPGFGGQNHPGYLTLLHELPTRLSIEQAIKAGREPVDDKRLHPKHFLRVVRNERRYWAGEAEAFSCACESSMDLADAGDEEAA